MTRDVALVTGASSGIGAVYADRLERRGLDLILTARDAARLDALGNRLRAETGAAVEILSADLTKPEGLDQVAARLADDPRITFLLNNAGVAAFTPFIQTDPDVLDTMVRLNVLATTRLAHAAARAFAARGAGVIVNLASAVAIAPKYRATVYGATKAFDLYLSLSMHEELEGSGVRVQAVLPGATRTEIWDRAGLPIDNIPTRLVMGVEEMVDAALAGLDQGEVVTIPSLEDPADWAAYVTARDRLSGSNTSRPAPAVRYGVTSAAE